MKIEFCIDVHDGACRDYEIVEFDNNASDEEIGQAFGKWFDNWWSTYVDAGWGFFHDFEDED